MEFSTSYVYYSNDLSVYYYFSQKALTYKYILHRLKATAKITALGLRKCEIGDTACTINGVCSPIITNSSNTNDGQLPKEILEREVGYTPVSIPSEYCKPLGFARLPKNSFVWMFVPDGPIGKPGVGLKLASWTHPILQTYVDICI